jgi:hypothetical protein
MIALKQWWQGMSHKDQNLVLVLGAMLCLGLYGFYYAGLYKDIAHAESMISRANNRIKVKYDKVQEPKENPVLLKKQLDDLKLTLQEKNKKLAEIEASLIPLDSMEHIQKMRLSLSRLAERSGMVIRRMEGVQSRRTSNTASVPGEDFLRTQTDNRYRRPLIKLNATVSFRGLLAFLDGLGELEYNVSPVNLNITALVPEKLDPHGALQQQQYLQLQIVLAL